MVRSMSDHLIFGPPNSPNFQFSPHFEHTFTEEAQEWKTVEHYVCAHMFVGEKYAALIEKIRTAPRTKKCKLLVDANRGHVRADWDEVKEDVMKRALRVKFQDKELGIKLMNSGQRPLVYDDCYDPYWGSGRGGKGKNRLGKLLEEVREELKANR